MTQRNINLFKQAWTGIQSITAKITGTNTDAVYVETSDADATAADMLNGKTAYVNASKVTGSIATKSSSDLTASGATVTAPAGYYASNASKAISTATIDEFANGISWNTAQHKATVTPYFITENGGYIEPDEYQGDSTTITASQLVSGSETKTANGTYDVTNLAELVVNVSGGGGLTKLATKDLGTISTSSTSAADTGQTITVTGIDGYDVLVAIAHTTTHTNNRHVATSTLINLQATSSIDTANGVAVASSRQNYKLTSGGVMQARASGTAYGIYVYSASTPSNGSTTLTMYQRYNGTQTGTINGSYTLDVYGVTLRDLI